MAGKSGTRDELLEVATDLFAANGFAGTSIRAIANQMGTSVSNIYHYFGNKEGLWLQILEYSVMDLPEQLKAAMEEGDDPVDRFKRLIRAHLKSAGGHRREWRIFFIGEDRLSTAGAEVNRKLQRRIYEIYVAALEDLRGAGLAQDCHPKVLTFNIFGIINWFLRWFRTGGELSADQAYDEIITFILRGMGIPNPGPGHGVKE